MSRSKRTQEEEIQHLKRKLRKLEAQETAISITGEYKDRASASSRSGNTARIDSDNGIPSTSVETLVQKPSPSASREPARTQPPTRLDSTDEHIITIGDPRASLNVSKVHSSRSGSPANGNDSDEPIAESQTKLSRMGAHNSKTKQPENRYAMKANSSKDDPWTKCNDIEIEREPGEYLSATEIDSSEIELQPTLNGKEAHTSTPVGLQVNSETKNPKRKSRASLDTSEPNISKNKPRTSSNNSQTLSTDSSITLDRNEALLQALGDDLSLSGESIHPSLAQKWVTILRKGLPDEDKQKLLREYAAPENCKFLKAPTLNEEVSATVEFQARRRDKIMENKQNQLGLGITAIGRAITMLLNQGENYEVNAIRHFNHGCRLLLDLHFVDTHTRRHLFQKDLNRSDVFRNLRISDFERDETLFGNKVTKLVKKQGIPTTPIHGRPSSSSYGDLPLNRSRHSNFDANLARDGEPPRYRRN